jgi:phage terminase small subunit
MDPLAVAILLLIGFALGYGVREIISRRRHREAERRRQNTAGPY